MTGSVGELCGELCNMNNAKRIIQNEL